MTRLCLLLLQHKVGPAGAIAGINPSEQMLAVAADRVAQRGWDNVRLLAAPVARRRSTPPRRPPCSARYTTCCSPRAALGEVFGHLRPSGAVDTARWEAVRLLDVGTCGFTSWPSTGYVALGHVRGRATSRRQATRCSRATPSAEMKGPSNDNQYR